MRVPAAGWPGGPGPVPPPPRWEHRAPACDGELTVGQIAAGLAVLAERDVAQVRAELLPAVRELVADGLLLPG